MMNVTKRLSAMLAAMIMVFCTPLFVFAAGQTELRDDAELFTSEEETQLQAELDAFAQKTGWVAVIYTNNEGKTEDECRRLRYSHVSAPRWRCVSRLFVRCRYCLG